MTTRPVTVAIIGCGFAGLAAAIELKRVGIDDLMVFEQAGDIGGVWRDNTYPGAACDVASALYSFSFEPNPTWSRAFAPQSEIHAYLQHCAEKYDVTRHISFNTQITTAAFDDAEGTWQLETAQGQRYAARVLVSACGQLRRPHVPEIPGIEDYSGVVFHSAQWDHKFDPRGKRIAVVGSGASAVQIIPQIAGEVAQLTVFQRSAEYLIPKLDFQLGRRSHRLFVRFPLALRALRAVWWLLNESMIPALTRTMSRRTRTVFLAPLYIAAAAQRRWQVRDPTLRAKLTPNYQLGCKRILLSSNYYPALSLPTTTVITDAITRFTGDGVTTSDGITREFDAIVLATGFRTNDFVAPMDVRGLHGQDLATPGRPAQRPTSA
jgi:cation diffusion facilitator CzcD-associated flavoprotein CzcO